MSTAARALSVGDPLLALKHVGLRSDPPSLALRGIALAQLGEWAKALLLLRRAAKGFGDAEPVARARVIVAAAEVALALRDLRGAARGLDDAIRLLGRRGDFVNAAFARLLQVRRLVLLGDRAAFDLRALVVACLPRRQDGAAVAAIVGLPVHVAPAGGRAPFVIAAVGCKENEQRTAQPRKLGAHFHDLLDSIFTEVPGHCQARCGWIRTAPCNRVR